VPHLSLHHGRLADGRLVDIEVVDGRLVEVRPSAGSPAPAPATDYLRGRPGNPPEPGDAFRVDFSDWVDGADPRRVDLGGRLVLPTLVNGHAHLDKTFTGAAWQPHRPGTSIADRVDHERRLRTQVEVPVARRAAALAAMLVQQGTGFVRTHVDIDLDVGLHHVEQVLDLREDLGALLQMQVVAFPQSGIVTSPGVAGLLEDALRLGADAVGGLDPDGFDGDAPTHLDVVFGLAERYGVAVDVHLHDLGAPAAEQLRLIADRTKALSMEGRVVVSHAYGLGTLAPDDLHRVGERLAETGIAVMTNGPAGPMPPVLALRALGVTVFSGTDNIRDAWWPYGDGDMLAIARTVAYQSGFRSDDELGVALDLVTHAGARALGIDRYGIVPGAPADLVVVDASCAAEAVAATAARVVVRAGRPMPAARPAGEGRGSPPLIDHPRPTDRLELIPSRS
jgi:cytosine deaminase